RALIDGKEARADELLLQCVETGAKQYMQWQAARTVLLRRHGADAFVVSIGAAFEVQKIDDRDLLVVTSVLDKPPGAALWQGLKVGDVLLRVSDAPYDAAAIERTWSTKRVGHDVHLTIRRDGEESVVMLRLGWQRR
ncbi:MAG: PDZ domain-containing protein, partial [Planctomycetota bacterium]